MRFSLTTLALAALPLGLAGCPSSQSPCAAASQHVSECMGGKAHVNQTTCTSAAAELLLETPCEKLQTRAAQADWGSTLCDLFGDIIGDLCGLLSSGDDSTEDQPASEDTSGDQDQSSEDNSGDESGATVDCAAPCDFAVTCHFFDTSASCEQRWCDAADQASRLSLVNAADCKEASAIILSSAPAR